MTLTEQALTQADFILDRMIHNRDRGIPADTCDIAAMRDARTAIAAALAPGNAAASTTPAAIPWTGPVPGTCNRCRRPLTPMRTFINLHAQGVFCDTCAATEPLPRTGVPHRYRLKHNSQIWLRDTLPYTQPTPTPGPATH